LKKIPDDLGTLDRLPFQPLTPMGKNKSIHLTYLKSFLENKNFRVCYLSIKTYCVKIL